MLLKSYATHLKRHHLEALATENLRLARAYEVPLLRPVSPLADDELLALTKAGLGELLTDLEAAPPHVELPGGSLADIRPGDRVLVYAAQKLALIRLMPTYTQDPEVLVGLVMELEDHYARAQEQQALNEEKRSHDRRVGAEVVIMRSHGDAGDLAGFSKITPYLTERRLSQELAEKNHALQLAIEELRQVEREKDEFLSVISHELRTPLHFITGFASILEDQVAGPLNEVQADYLGKILQGADRMLGLVNNLLDIGRMQAGKFQLVPCVVAYPSLVDEVVASLSPLAHERRIEVAVDLQVPAPVTLDGERITQVLSNLLDNAIKFTPVGGRIRIHARLEGDRLVTEVNDSGPGIGEADIPKLFNPFKQLDMESTRKVGGTGLGLSICKAIVEAHEGKIGIRSLPGAGSTFWFSLPVQAGMAADAGSERSALNNLQG